MAQTQKKAPKAQTKAATPKKAAPKPSVEVYGFKSGWTGPSDVTNARVSKTKIDPARFNAFPNGAVTQRDQDAMVALRSQFKAGPFERRNVDAGILRRLMERGLANAVDAKDVNAPTSKFALTKAGLGQ